MRGVLKSVDEAYSRYEMTGICLGNAEKMPARDSHQLSTRLEGKFPSGKDETRSDWVSCRPLSAPPADTSLSARHVKSETANDELQCGIS